MRTYLIQSSVHVHRCRKSIDCCFLVQRYLTPSTGHTEKPWKCRNWRFLTWTSIKNSPTHGPWKYINWHLKARDIHYTAFHTSTLTSVAHKLAFTCDNMQYTTFWMGTVTSVEHRMVFPGVDIHSEGFCTCARLSFMQKLVFPSMGIHFTAYHFVHH